MEIRLSSVLLAAALLSGCGWFHRGEKAPTQVVAEEPQGEPSIVEPQVNRRVVKTPKIKAKDFELGGYFGALSIQDFGTNPVYGVRAAYHVSEDIFLEGFLGRSKAGTTSLVKDGVSGTLVDPLEPDQYGAAIAQYAADPALRARHGGAGLDYASTRDWDVINGDVVKLYAVKHNPFVYFTSVQEGGLNNVASFEGDNGLFGDLASGNVPTFSFIAPNQFNDQHGRGNAGPYCNYDPVSNGTQAGLNPALIIKGDQTVQKIVTAIHSSPAWKNGRNAIVVLWDENDYALSPINNQVMTIVETNHGPRHKTSAKYYNHFSLLKTVEGGLGVGCLNHACDSSTKVMSDLFGGGEDE